MKIPARQLSMVVAFLVSTSLPPRLFAANNPILQGAGCKSLGDAALLGAVPDQLSSRKVVTIGHPKRGSFLDQLSSGATSATVEEFQEAVPTAASDVSGGYILLLDGHDLRERGSSADAQGVSAAIAKALALNVPIVLENAELAHVKRLSGLGVAPPSGIVVIHSHPGSRAFTITAINPPPEGSTQPFATNAVNRALEKGSILRAAQDSSRQAYAARVWDVWLHQENVRCTPPGQGATTTQTGNLDFGIEFTLVAGNSPQQKALNVQYIGAGFTPIAPGSNVIFDPTGFSRFRGAYTLKLNYDGKLIAPPEAHLNGDANAVEPATAVNQHAVAKTNGWSFSLGGSCGVAKTGPNCSITAGFSFSSSTTNTTNVAERVINASSNFGQNQDGNTEGDQTITYLLSSTATTNGGTPINLPENDWYGFFGHGTHERDCFINGGFNSNDILCSGGQWWDGREKFPSDDNPDVHLWPPWTKSAALTEGEAGYTMDAGFPGDLTYAASFTATAGVFALGNGQPSDRLADDHAVGACPLIFGACPWYGMRLNTDSATASSNITINANEVNFSGLPTCSMAQFQQTDVGIWEISNQTKEVLSISQMSSTPFTTPENTQNMYYSAVDPNYALGVSQAQIVAGPPAQYGIQPGQHGYISLCSLQPNVKDAMRAYFGTTSYLDFNGDGTFASAAGLAVRVEPEERLITVNQPIAVSTTTSLSSSTSQSTVDQPVKLIAAVQPAPGAGQPTGQVSFLLGSGPNHTSLGSGTLASLPACPNQVCAELSTTALPVGTDQVSAQYRGDPSFSPSTSNYLTQNVDKHTATFSDLTPSQTVSGPGSAVVLAGVVSAPGPAYAPAGEIVTVKIGNLAQSAIIGANGTFSSGEFATGSLSPGEYPITYEYSGDPRFAKASDNSTRLTVKIQPVFSNLTPSQTISAGTSSITLSGKITTSLGISLPQGAVVSISIADKNTSAPVAPNGSFSASFDTSAIPASSTPYAITYSFAGWEPNFGPAKDSSTTLTVKNSGPSATTTTLTAGVQTCTTGVPFQFFITVTPSLKTAGVPSGQVVLSRKAADGSITQMGIQFLDGNGQWNPAENGTSDAIPPGNYIFIAHYLGSTDFQESAGMLPLSCTAD